MISKLFTNGHGTRDRDKALDEALDEMKRAGEDLVEAIRSRRKERQADAKAG